jgi:hypothetical protein
MIIQGEVNGKRKTALMDDITLGLVTVDFPHHEIHEGHAFSLVYSVASLGAMTTPDDTITLTFTTPNTTTHIHMTFSAYGTAGWLLSFIEAPSGGKENPTGSFTILNKDRNSAITSMLKDIAGTPVVNKVSYDATLATGGTTLWSEYLGGTSRPFAGGSPAGGRDEFILKINTTYQLALYGTDANPAILQMSWYEHADAL